MAQPQRPATVSADTLADQLRAAIVSRGVSAYRLAKHTGLDARLVARFLLSDKDITLTTADRLAASLGLRLAELPAKKSPAASRASNPKASTLSHGDRPALLLLPSPAAEEPTDEAVPAFQISPL